MKTTRFFGAILAIAFFVSTTAWADATATVTPGVWDLYRGSSIATDAAGVQQRNFATEAACVEAARLLNITRKYTCRTRTGVSVVVTTTPPVPVNCEFTTNVTTSDWSVCSSNGTQTRTVTTTYTITRQAENGGTACPTNPPPVVETQTCTYVPPTDPPPPTGTVFYGPTSIVAGVTQVRRYSFDGKTTTSVLVTAAESGLPIRSGRLLRATPTTLTETFWNGVQPGDYVELAAGNYTTKFGEGDWYNAMGETYKKGTATLPITVVAAPGAKVSFTASSRPPLVFGNGDRATEFAAYLQFDGIDYFGSESCVSGGGHTTEPSGGPNETGGKFIRITGGSCTISDANGNTMTGMMDFQNDGCQVLGVVFKDPANRVVINNNHGVYIQGGADDIEVAFNTFVGLHMGHVVQVHQDANNPGKRYERVNIHDNYFRATNYNDMRGISVVNVDDLSTIFLNNNVLEHLGWSDWGCLNVYGGTVTVENLTCTDTHAGINVYGSGAGYGGSVRKVLLNNSKICPSSGQKFTFNQGATSSSLVETNPRTCP